MSARPHRTVVKAGTPPEVEAIMDALAAPFEPAEVKFKPAVVTGNRAMALAYVDARVIQDRLDDVLGVAGWQDNYKCLPDGSVVCRLRLRLGGEWITKVDVGGPSEQPDGGDRIKAAFSDALKRAAVKFGVGRYLYRLPSQWLDWDAQRRQFLRTPTLPLWALPGKKETAPKPVAPAATAAPRVGVQALPASGTELHKRLTDYDARLSSQGLCGQGELVKHVVQEGVKAGYGPELVSWNGPAIAFAVDATKSFEARVRQKGSGRRNVA